MANVVTKTAFKKSTWKDVSAGAVAGGLQSVSSLVTGNGVLGGIISSVIVGAMPNGMIFDEMSKTAVIVNTIQDITNALLIG